jgi:hypothetical protein
VSAEISHFDTDERPNGEYDVTGGSFGATWQAQERFAVGLTGSHCTSGPARRTTGSPTTLTISRATRTPRSR